MTGTLAGRLWRDRTRTAGGGPGDGTSGSRSLVFGPLGLTVGGRAALHQAGNVIVAVTGGLLDRPVPNGAHGDGNGTPLDSAAPIAAAWRATGERCLADLPGDWLAIVWEPGIGRLTCARSARGPVRLFWCLGDGGFRFATRLAELSPAAGPAWRLNEDFLGELLANRITRDDSTPFAGVHRLPVGHLLQVTAEGTVRVRRWHHQDRTPLRIDRPTAVIELRQRLETVLADYVSPAGAGVLVSGGIDSTGVLGLARRVAGDRPIAACALTFPGQPHDESGWLDLIDVHAGGGDNAVRRLVPPAYDWPQWTGWSATSLLPPIRPNGAAIQATAGPLQAAGVHRVLTGEGGDDWYGGGPPHWAVQVGRGRPGPVWRAARAAYPGWKPSLSMFWYAGVAPLLPTVRRTPVPAWIGAGFAGRTRLAQRLRAADAAARRAVRDPVAARLARVDQPTWMWRTEAMRQRFAEGGVDLLHPLHDQRIVDLVARLPGEVLWRPDETKTLLRAAVADVVPPEILRRQSKAEFGGPVADAIRTVGGTRLLTGHPLVSEGYIHLPALRELEHRALACHDAGRRPRHAGEALGTLWAVLSTAVWFSAVWPP